MNIYKIERTSDTEYDEHDGFVIVAQSEDQAMVFAKEIHPREDWIIDDSLCYKVGKFTQHIVARPLILLSSFNAG